MLRSKIMKEASRFSVLLTLILLMISGKASADPQNLDVDFSFIKGSRAEIEKLDNFNLVTKEEFDEMDRAMKAFVPAGDSLFRNRADNYYYYSQLGTEDQELYDCLMVLTDYPDQEDNYSMFFSSEDPDSDNFMERVYTVYLAMTYDHPELFWLYNSTETSIVWSSSKEKAGDFYKVFFYYEVPYVNYREEVTAFNEAVEAMLADIDTSAPEVEMAAQIHDKLTELVTYDRDVADGSAYGDLAHTAFGALVHDSAGIPNYAVCDGYSLAYEYLLQQVGIECAVVGGSAGETEADMGGHAWNIVKLDGYWYEVDTTWDDLGDLEQYVEELPEDSEAGSYYREALADEAYRKVVGRYLFGKGTDEIRNFEVNDSHYYYTKDGLYLFTLVFPEHSVHVRDSECMPFTAFGELSSYTPVADGDLS